MIQKIKKIIAYISNLKLVPFLYADTVNDLKSPKILLGNILLNQILEKEISTLSDAEFSVFSQWGDDGIIQYLISKLDIPNKTFIEFGVENYRESNTRYLLINNKWHGLVIDGSQQNINFIQKDTISWAHHVFAECAFIKKSNINELLGGLISKGYDKEIGILSLDIDGNEFWIWEEINIVNPILVIVEYNAVFGPDNCWTIPYDENFNRFSLLPKGYIYYGSSLEALKMLATKKGYTFIGCNSNGNNSYFLRNDKIDPVEFLVKTAKFIDSSFQELWLVNKHLKYFGKNRIEFIKGEKVYDLINNKIVEI